MKKYIVLFATIILVVALYKIGRRMVLMPTMKFEAEPLTLLDTNLTTTIAAYKGNVLIVSCYQTWCVDCARETPALNELATSLSSKKFTVLYISDEPEDKVNRFRNRFASDKIIFATSHKRLGELGIRAYPSTFLINKKGEVIKTKLEGYNWMEDKTAIESLLSE